MNITRIVATPFLLAVVVTSLTGCPKFKSLSLKASCTHNMGASGGGCTASAEMMFESANRKLTPLASILSSISPYDIAPDAGAYELDTLGSTIPYPGTGTFVVTLTNSATGAVEAAQTFEWVKIGTVIKAADPDAINTWAYANAGSADKMSYSINRFQSNYGSGPQTLAIQSRYEGTTDSTYSVTFEGSHCPNYPTNQPCSM